MVGVRGGKSRSRSSDGKPIEKMEIFPHIHREWILFDTRVLSPKVEGNKYVAESLLEPLLLDREGSLGLLSPVPSDARLTR